MTDPPDCSDLDHHDIYSICERYRDHGIIHPDDDGWRIQCEVPAAPHQDGGGLPQAGARGAAAADGDGCVEVVQPKPGDGRR